MAFEYLDHEADVGIHATADTLEEAFEEGARAMFNTMVDITKVESRKKVEILASADSVESLFVDFLNKLLTKADTEGMVFSRFRVMITHKKTYTLTAYAWGEPLDQMRHDIKTEVKAATYSGLKCWNDTGGHHVQCVLDV